ncbi:MAG TPA: DUF748 domain-containing protein [Polyangia bacterium]
MIGAAVSLVLFTVIGFFVLPPIIRHVAESQLGEHLGRRASIGRIRVNPFALSLGIDDFQLYERDGTTPFVGFAHFYVNAQLSSVVRRAPVIKEVRLEGLHAHVVHTRATPEGFGDLTAYNFSDILAKVAADAAQHPSPPPPPSSGEPPRFSINNIHLLEGGVTFDDVPTSSHHEVAHLSIGVPFVSTLPLDIDTFVKPGLAVAIDGTPFSIDGQTKPFKDSLETTLELRLTALDLAPYQAYVPIPLKFHLDSGKLTVALDLSFVRPRDGQPAVTLKGRVALDQLVVRHADAAAAPILSLNTLALQIGRADLSAMSFHVDKVLLSGLEVHARRLRDGEIDLQRLVPASEKKTPAAAQPASSAPRFEVDDLALEKIDVHLRDETVRPAFVETVRALAIHVAHLSNAPGARATVTTQVTLVPGGTLAQSGTLSLEPFAAEGKLTLDDLEPARFAPYYQDQIAFDLAEGKLRVGTGYRVATKGRRTSVGLEDAFVELTNLKLRRRAAEGHAAPEDFFRMADFAVRKVNVDLDARTVQVGAVTSHDVRVRASRGETGVLDLTTLVPPPRASVAKAGGAPAAAAPPPVESPSSPAWTVNVANLDLTSWAARFEDRAVKPRATLAVDGLTVHADGLSTRPGSRANFDVKLTLNQSGKLQIGGSAVAEPLAANVRLDLRDIQILPFQPYFRDKVNMVITDGAVSLKGQVKVDSPAGPAKGHVAAPHIAFTGDFGLTNFGALDGYKNEKLLAWKSFHIGGIDFVSEPTTVAVREISLTDYAARLMIFPDAHFNLEDIAVKAPPVPAPGKGAASASSRPAAVAKHEAAPAAAAPRIAIAQVTLQGGEVAFTDRLIKPNYSAQLTELGGRITGLSTDAQSTAEVSLRGAVDHSGTLMIDGKMNPLAKDLFVDLKINVNDFELPPTSPYSGRYAGYGIEKGKLSLSLDYHIAGRKLDAKNKLTLDQFTFGDKVQSPDAVKLPLKLAIALLKDRHGVIDIDLPISGSLDDPQFRLAPLIWKTLGNLVVKAVTAPFSLIARAFGGGDEESYLEFASGLAQVTPKGLAKLKGIGKALQERPGLSFEIEGLADPQSDKTGLRQDLYEKKLRAQKQRLIAESGQASPPAGDVQIAAAERPKLIEAVYHGEPFPKPQAPNGSEKVLASTEMEKLILANIRVEADELRQLALRRASAVKDVLAKAAPDAAPRLFLINPRTTSPGNRVELKLKKD